tara:strand:- start:289 stop:588 length:300 start_codon:yes stop_codon:yes gene_type:complete
MTAREKIAEFNGHAILWDGYDDAIIGYCSRNEVAIYDEGKMIEIATKLVSDHLDEGDDPRTVAIEYLEYNVWCAYVGDFTPIHIFIFEKTEKNELVNII